VKVNQKTIYAEMIRWFIRQPELSGGRFHGHNFWDQWKQINHLGSPLNCTVAIKKGCVVVILEKPL
jgi:hypothetical protein